MNISMWILRCAVHQCEVYLFDFKQISSEINVLISLKQKKGTEYYLSFVLNKME